jgi:hypothetical protein
MKGQYWKKSKNLLKAACLSAALATAWGAGTAPPAAEAALNTFDLSSPYYYQDAQGNTVQVGNGISSDYKLTNVSILYYLNTSGGFPPKDPILGAFYHQSLGAGLGAGPNNVTVTNVDIQGNGFGNYTIVGLFDSNGVTNGGVTIGMNSAAASIANGHLGGADWVSFFGSSSFFSASNVRDWILNKQYDNLQLFYNAYGDQYITSGNKNFVGDMIVRGYGLDVWVADTDTENGKGPLGELTLVNFPVPVPLPPTLFLMVPSLGVAFLLRRKKEDD